MIGRSLRARGRRVTAGCAAGALAVVGLVLAPHNALAGSSGQASTACTDGIGGEMEVPIMPSPVPGPFTLAVEIGTAGSLENVHAALCYSDNQPGTPSSLAGGNIGFNGPQIGSGSTTPQGWVDCANDTAVVFAPQCELGVTAASTVGNCGGTCSEQVTVTIPYQLCVGLVAGSHVVGNSSCFGTGNGAGMVGETGLIVTTLGIGPGPNGTTGITVAPNTQVWVDGVQEPLGGAAGAGVNVGSVGAGTGGSLGCLGPLGCNVVPGVWAGTSGAALAWVSIPGVGSLPINPPGAPAPQCFAVGTTCPTPF